MLAGVCLLAWGVMGFGDERPVEVVIPRECMETVALKPEAECHGLDRKHLACTGLVLTVKSGCETLRVK